MKCSSERTGRAFRATRSRTAPSELSLLLTFTSITFPALSFSFVGIRFFGDFECLAVITQVSERNLDEVEQHIALPA